MGEIARDYELDLDGNPELVEIEGSWKAGRDSDKPGILMYGNPDPDNDDRQNPYRQEFSSVMPKIWANWSAMEMKLWRCLLVSSIRRFKN